MGNDKSETLVLPAVSLQVISHRHVTTPRQHRDKMRDERPRPIGPRK